MVEVKRCYRIVHLLKWKLRDDIILWYFKVFWSISGNFMVFQVILWYFRLFYGISGIFGHLRYFRIFLDILGYIRVF